MIKTNDETERTLWCGNVDDKVTEELLYELFLQAGPLEKVKIVGDTRYGPKYAFITFKHSVSVPYTLQLMNGIRLYDRPLRLKERSGSGCTGSAGGSVEALPAQPPMGPPQRMPPSFLATPPSFMTMLSANSATFDHSTSGGHAGLLRSSSEPGGLGSKYNESRVHERAAGPYSRPYQRSTHGIVAQNIASQLYMQNQANVVAQRNQPFVARTLYPNSYRQQNHYQQFNNPGGFRRR